MSSSPFIKYGCWYDCQGKVEDLEFKPFFILAKSTYGLTDYTLLDEEWEYDIIGFNTDGCVLKIAFDMFDKGYNFRVLSQYCYCSTGIEAHTFGKAVLRNNLGTAFVE